MREVLLTVLGPPPPYYLSCLESWCLWSFSLWTGMIMFTRYGELLSSSESQAIPFRTDTSVGIVFWGLTNATLGTYIAFTLLTRLRRHEVCTTRRCGVLVLSALSLTLGCWACQLSSSRIHLAPLDDLGTELFIGFNLGFIALSLCAPTVLVLGAFVILDLRLSSKNSNSAILCSCCACGLLVGLSVGFMNYAPYLSLPSFTATFASTQVLLGILLNMSGSLFSFLALTFCARSNKKLKCIYILRTLIPLVFGCSAVGAGLLALSGTRFEPRGTHVGELGEGGQKQRDVLTLAIPAIISLTLACSSVLLIFISSSESRNARPSASRLIIASITFTSDGRVLVNEKGMLPTQTVNLQGLPKDILDELDIRRTTFHWLLAISFDWSIVSPFLQRITYIPSSPDKRPSLWHSSFCSISSLLAFFNIKSLSSDDAVPVQAQLKLRLLEAATQLAAQLDLPLEKLGTLHDRALETGTRMGIAEFLLLSEQAASQLRDAEKALKASADANKGLMLFFIRTLSHRPSGVAAHTSPRGVDGVYTYENDEGIKDAEYDWQKKCIARGYKIRFMGRFRDILAEATGATQADIDKVLHGCKDAATRRARSVLEAGRTYVSLFVERLSYDGSSEVLVYDFAKHQLPSYQLGLQELTWEMRDWLQGMSGFTASDIIQICEDDVEQGRMHLSLSSHSSHNHSFEYEEEQLQVSLLDFKEAFASALARLMRDMSFVGESLETWTYLTPHVLDVPSANPQSSDVAAPAHMIVLHAQIPDPSDVDPLEDESDFTHVSASSAAHSTQHAMPSVFEYTPRALFDVAHALAVSPPSREVFRAEATHELEHLFDVGTSARAQRPDLVARGAAPGRLPCALVSSFSIDTVSEEDGGYRSAAARVRKGWAAVKARARALKLPTRSGYHGGSRSNRIPMSQLESGSRIQLLSHSHSGSASTATTSTATSSVTEPLAAFYPHSRSTVEVNSSFRAATVLPSYRDCGNTESRSWGRSASKTSRSDWDEPVRVPPTPFLVPGRRSCAASKSVPNIAATENGFF